jgi:hypothetical protein
VVERYDGRGDPFSFRGIHQLLNKQDSLTPHPQQELLAEAIYILLIHIHRDCRPDGPGSFRERRQSYPELAYGPERSRRDATRRLGGHFDPVGIDGGEAQRS